MCKFDSFCVPRPKNVQISFHSDWLIGKYPGPALRHRVTVSVIINELLTKFRETGGSDQVINDLSEAFICYLRL